jgi:hypothetical protein
VKKKTKKMFVILHVYIEMKSRKATCHADWLISLDETRNRLIFCVVSYSASSLENRQTFKSKQEKEKKKRDAIFPFAAGYQSND